MSFFDELKRRNVIRVGIAYAAVAWLLAQVADLAFDAFDAPEWALRSLLIALVVGFPITLVIAWIYELTPEGIRVDEDGVSDAPVGAERRLDRIIIGVLVAAVSVLLVERFYISQAITVEETQSIAVLPFVNMSDDSDHFADGLSEELLNLLANNPGLKVAGRTSSFAFKGRNEDLREVGKALGVEHLLEGSVRRSGSQLRITAQLIKADDGFHLWSETYDRQLADVFNIQDNVARQISNALELTLMPDAIRPTDSVEAYALYLEALAMSDFADGVIDDAIDLLDRAIGLDPGFAKAWELKATAYWQAAGWTIEVERGRELVYEAAMRALELDPTLVVSRAFSISANDERMLWAEYLEALEAAVREQPNNIRVLDTYSNTLLLAGYVAESLEYANRIKALEPLSPLGYYRVAFAESAQGRRDAARSAWAQAVELGARDMQGFITVDFLVAGDIEAAIAAEEKYNRTFGIDPAEARTMIESAIDPEHGKAYLDDMIKSQFEEAKAAGKLNAAFNAYNWYLAFGYVDDAWRAIEQDRATSRSTWRNSQFIEFVGVSFPGTGFTRHPGFATPGRVELWDSRGKPDMCDKIDGEWVCN